MHVSELGIIEVNEAPPPLELTPAEIAALADELMHYHAAFAELYYRAEQAHWAFKYLQGLLLPIERKSIEPMALEWGNLQAMQQFSNKGSGRILRCCENTGPWGTRPWGQPTAYGSPMVRTFPSKGSIRSGEPASGAATWGRSRIVRRACLPRMTLCLLADHFLVHARRRVKKGAPTLTFWQALLLLASVLSQKLLAPHEALERVRYIQGETTRPICPIVNASCSDWVACDKVTL